MKWKFAASFIATLLTMMGWESVPTAEGKVNLSADEEEKLKKALLDKDAGDPDGTKGLAKMVEKLQKDLDAHAKEKGDLNEMLREQLQETNLSDKEIDDVLENKDGTIDLKEVSQLLKGHNKELKETIEKLMRTEEPEAQQEQIENMRNTVMRHSKTHLMGDNKNVLNAFENRPWNQAAAGVKGVMPTFASDSVEVQQLKQDLSLYNRDTDANIKSLFRDLLTLPSFWNLRSNVDDRVADGNIVTAEITQARKKGWLPKNKQLIQPEEAKVYPAQIDIEYAGYWLQEKLTSWISQYNKEGSQAYKWTFVRFLVNELDKRRAQEDRIVAINGVYVKPPVDTDIPGLAIHRGDGIGVKLWRALNIEKKYKVAQIGKPTKSNIVDYVKDLIEANIPEEERNNPNMVLYLSHDWMRAHAERKRQLFGGDNNYTGQELLEIENYPNYKFCPLVDLGGTDFMFITYNDNIELMQNIAGEQSIYKMEALKRDMFIFGDYKWGPRIKHIGTKVKDTDPTAFKVQTVWSNGLPPFKSDFYVRLYDDTTGEIAIDEYYSNITITDNWATNITDINGAFENQVIRVKGNTAAGGQVVATGNITLTGGVFNLNTGGVLTLLADANGALTELKRTVEPPAAPTTEAEFDTTAVDADESSVFNYTGGVATLAEIVNGIEGQVITINGGAGGALTINDVAENIEVNGAAVLANAADNIKFVKADGVWYESERTIA